MGFATDDLCIRDSFRIAQERGLGFTFTPNETETEVHPNTVDIRMENAAGQVMTVRGESLGGGKVRIVRINGVKVDFTGEYSAVIAIHQDKPGVVAILPRCSATGESTWPLCGCSGRARGTPLIASSNPTGPSARGHHRRAENQPQHP